MRDVNELLAGAAKLDDYNEAMEELDELNDQWPMLALAMQSAIDGMRFADRASQKAAHDQWQFCKFNVDGWAVEIWQGTTKAMGLLLDAIEEKLHDLEKDKAGPLRGQLAEMQEKMGEAAGMLTSINDNLDVRAEMAALTVRMNDVRQKLFDVEREAEVVANFRRDELRSKVGLPQSDEQVVEHFATKAYGEARAKVDAALGSDAALGARVDRLAVKIDAIQRRLPNEVLS